jgi:hypothetical protein
MRLGETPKHIYTINDQVPITQIISGETTMRRLKAKKVTPERRALEIKALVILQNDFNARHGLPPITEADLQ